MWKSCIYLYINKISFVRYHKKWIVQCGWFISLSKLEPHIYYQQHFIIDNLYGSLQCILMIKNVLKRRTLSFFLIIFLSLYLSRFSFYIAVYIIFFRIYISRIDRLMTVLVFKKLLSLRILMIIIICLFLNGNTEEGHCFYEKCNIKH